ncbi:MAG: 2OG-Fe(II) oxygenase [Blastocatellia bacterium]
MKDSETLVVHLAEYGWAVTSELFAPETIVALAQEVRALWTNDSFAAAGVGRGAALQVRAEIRSDHILWLDDERLTAPQQAYHQTLEALRAELNAQLFVGVQELEAHYAVYPPGAFYQKHLDRFSNADERIISCVLYLNPNWEERFGGALRLYEDQRAIDVYPQAGTFVIFRSDAIYHEVLPATHERFSLTGWFKRRSLARLV